MSDWYYHFSRFIIILVSYLLLNVFGFLPQFSCHFNKIVLAMDVSTIKDFIFDIEIYPLVNVNPTPSPHAYYLGISNVFSLLLKN